MSDDHLLGLWQRAFCYYLVNSLIRTPAPARKFPRKWLASVSGRLDFGEVPFPHRGGLAARTHRGHRAKPRHRLYLGRDGGGTCRHRKDRGSRASGPPTLHSQCTFDNVQSFPRNAETDSAVLKQKIYRSHRPRTAGASPVGDRSSRFTALGSPPCSTTPRRPRQPR